MRGKGVSATFDHPITSATPPIRIHRALLAHTCGREKNTSGKPQGLSEVAASCIAIANYVCPARYCL
jgi:hypothetical protein